MCGRTGKHVSRLLLNFSQLEQKLHKCTFDNLIFPFLINDTKIQQPVWYAEYCSGLRY